MRVTLGLAGRQGRINHDGLALDLWQLRVKKIRQLLFGRRVLGRTGPYENRQHPHVWLARSTLVTKMIRPWVRQPGLQGSSLAVFLAGHRAVREQGVEARLLRPVAKRPVNVARER